MKSNAASCCICLDRKEKNEKEKESCVFSLVFFYTSSRFFRAYDTNPIEGIEFYLFIHSKAMASSIPKSTRSREQILNDFQVNDIRVDCEESVRNSFSLGNHRNQHRRRHSLSRSLRLEIGGRTNDHRSDGKEKTLKVSLVLRTSPMIIGMESNSNEIYLMIQVKHECSSLIDSHRFL